MCRACCAGPQDGSPISCEVSDLTVGKGVFQAVDVAHALTLQGGFECQDGTVSAFDENAQVRLGGYAVVRRGDERIERLKSDVVVEVEEGIGFLAGVSNLSSDRCTVGQGCGTATDREELSLESVDPEILDIDRTAGEDRFGVGRRIRSALDR